MSRSHIPKTTLTSVVHPKAFTLLSVIAYGALHSLLASPWAKRQARIIFGRLADRFYRLLYNALSIITLLPVLAIIAMEPGDILYRLPMPWTILALTGQGIALLVETL